MIALSLIPVADPDDATDAERIVATAAYLAAAGLDPVGYLRGGDELEHDLLLDVARRVHQIRDIERHNLAVEIANCVGEMFK